MIDAIRGTGQNRPLPRKGGDRPVDPVDRAARPGEGQGQSDPRPEGRALAVARPVVDDRSAHRATYSSAFMAQVIGQAGNPISGERRVRRDPALVTARARAAYGVAARLATALEPGFLAVKVV